MTYVQSVINNKANSNTSYQIKTSETTTTAGHSRRCCGSSDCVGGMTGSHVAGRGRLGIQRSCHRESQTQRPGGYRDSPL